MARSAETAHPTAQVWALPLADAANASKATATITVSASSAKAGTIALYVAGQRVAAGVKGWRQRQRDCDGNKNSPKQSRAYPARGSCFAHQHQRRHPHLPLGWNNGQPN